MFLIYASVVSKRVSLSTENHGATAYEIVGIENMVEVCNFEQTGSGRSSTMSILLDRIVGSSDQ